MYKCSKRLKVGLVLIATAVLCGAGAILLLQLSEPVFIQNYSSYQWGMDNYNQNNLSYTMQYIANINDTRTVTGIVFSEVDNRKLQFYATETQPAMGMVWNSQQSSNVQKVGRYAVHTLTVTVAPIGQEVMKEDITLHEATVTFNNAETQTVDIGSIELLKEDVKHGLLSQYSSSSSSDGTAGSVMRVDGNIKVIGVESTHLPEIGDLLKMSVNGWDYTEVGGLGFTQGSDLVLRSKFTISDDVLARFSCYDVRLTLRYQDANGTEGSSRLYNISHTPTYSDFWDLSRYLKARGAFG